MSHKIGRTLEVPQDVRHDIERGTRPSSQPCPLPHGGQAAIIIEKPAHRVRHHLGAPELGARSGRGAASANDHERDGPVEREQVLDHAAHARGPQTATSQPGLRANAPPSARAACSCREPTEACRISTRGRQGSVRGVPPAGGRFEGSGRPSHDDPLPFALRRLRLQRRPGELPGLLELRHAALIVRAHFVVTLLQTLPIRRVRRRDLLLQRLQLGVAFPLECVDAGL